MFSYVFFCSTYTTVIKIGVLLTVYRPMVTNIKSVDQSCTIKQSFGKTTETEDFTNKRSFIYKTNNIVIIYIGSDLLNF